MRRLLTIVLLCAALLLVGCQTGAPETKAAVEAGIRAYLAQRPGLAMDRMEMEVKNVEFKGETAEADVVFRVKGGPGEMGMHYTLRRQAEQWVVEKSGAGPATGTQLPPGHPPLQPAPAEKPPRSSQP